MRRLALERVALGCLLLFVLLFSSNPAIAAPLPSLCNRISVTQGKWFPAAPEIHLKAEPFSMEFLLGAGQAISLNASNGRLNFGEFQKNGTIPDRLLVGGIGIAEYRGADAKKNDTLFLTDAALHLTYFESATDHRCVRITELPEGTGCMRSVSKMVITEGKDKKSDWKSFKFKTIYLLAFTSDYDSNTGIFKPLSACAFKITFDK